MSVEKIVIICPKKDLVEKWKIAIKENSEDIKVEEFPNDSEREKTQFVLAFGAPEGAFENYPNLKVIASMAAGINHITSHKNLPENVLITKVNDPIHKRDIADFVLALTLSYMRGLPVYFQQQQEAKWESHSYIRPEETTIGIMGIGSVGTTIGKLLLKNNFKATGWSRSEKDIGQIKTFHGDSQRSDFLKTANILICALPLTKDTEGILNSGVFNSLPKGSYLINIGRGEQLVDNDLISAIEKEQLSGAALDVFHIEPLPKNHPFWNNEKIIITPHTAGNINPKSAVKKILRNYEAMKNGEKLVDAVDLKRGY